MRVRGGAQVEAEPAPAGYHVDGAVGHLQHADGAHRIAVARGATLKNCILFESVSVGEKVHLTNCVIGPDGRVKENISVYDAAVLNIRA